MEFIFWYAVLCCAQLLGHVQLFATPWTVTCQIPLPMEFSRQEYWSGCHFLHQSSSQPGMEAESLVSPALVGRFFTTSASWVRSFWYISPIEF